MTTTQTDHEQAARTQTAVIVLAAGSGTRMKSATPKMLHRVCGRTMLGHALHAAAGIQPDSIVVVVGHQREQVRSAVEDLAVDLGVPVTTAVQEEQNGTGGAVASGMAALPADFSGTILVTTSDIPLLDAHTLREVVTRHDIRPRAAVTVLTSTAPDPTGYGRIVRNDDGEVLSIVEHKDASHDELAIDEVNSGIYGFDAQVLRDKLGKLSTDNSQGELYLTGIIQLARQDNGLIRGHRIEDPDLVAGVNDRVQLAALAGEMNRRLCETAMREGATIVDPGSTWVDVDVKIGRDVTILPGTHLTGSTVIGDTATIGPDTTLQDTTVGEGATVVRTHAVGASIGARAQVGPFAYLRPQADLGEGSKIGTFVEVKKSRVGAHSKVPHLTYVGDAQIGDHTNIGASSVFVNYDGVNKNRTVIGDHCRTGSDTMFIAPVTVGDGAYSGAGTVIKDDVPPGALAVSGGRQRNIDDWVIQNRPDTGSAEAALRARNDS
ncbi:bifunctional UDP-N-acetylglucosamine diphosphorylase/glucosamine-1-phosphate N-acetyltransferase GlmU [Rhodococcus sp. IEGM 1408]|uniref:bifunctional UDP-N-acetylglucosamine diphosphorylase/glucosamine-1-phosphate N-acetyltransferase GlmU n=1 Tax=Rhodococcus sp. IEGM 1408 TaxID=3082220 RepID=UPI002954C745|nr:bifunctional UDP-N-acetylglucosamine diphosphorylase/glucosamine-1-phosphate N-acetyltransferase GlmU [Rhodococcus sp. IEGM 1408]MDV8001076.1 bifunctional UDP-N-acetylglucosamine diphosphorylase/glucosamine-1-phosphate N-acetyltransferase GlmU [Rhodococcus sp. IEGM 1408]